MDVADMLSYLNSEREQIVRSLDDPNLTLGHESRIDRLRKESEYAITMAQMKTIVSSAYMNLAAINSQIILFLNAQSAEACDGAP